MPCVVVTDFVATGGFVATDDVFVDGFVVGVDDGFVVGVDDGFFVGADDGFFVGVLVGVADGFGVVAFASEAGGTKSVDGTGGVGGAGTSGDGDRIPTSTIRS